MFVWLAVCMKFGWLGGWKICGCLNEVLLVGWLKDLWLFEWLVLYGCFGRFVAASECYGRFCQMFVALLFRGVMVVWSKCLEDCIKFCQCFQNFVRFNNRNPRALQFSHTGSAKFCKGLFTKILHIPRA